ncbi:DUF1329 domain-containing protein [Zavarzinia sp. CC-PAN008]|uniref:DUF1329 domain-containing protein n=1 Tax=Zavarzinia sp. CC-PAN008 TaxID=3243332 RepID=UPI003F743734
MKRALALLGCVVGAGLTASLALAGVSQEEADRLGKDLTPLGAQRAGNGGDIPDWDGGITAPPPGFVPGEHHRNPFPDDQVKFTINGQNADQYKDNLTVGQMTMLKTYPTYQMKVYQTRRTCSASEKIYEWTKRNAVSSTLISGGNGIDGALVGTPFPVLSPQDPDAGIKVYWNHRFSPRNFKFRRWQAFASVTTGGDYQVIRSTDEGIIHYSGPGMVEVGDATDINGINNRFVTYLNVTTQPARLAGNIVLVYDTIDPAKGERQAWIYNPGTRRVLRAPQIAYDNPLTNGDGLGTSDQFDMMNGNPDRYSFKLAGGPDGKREIYIGYNAFDFASNTNTYAQMLTPGHPNQDKLRYELHRHWVVEATLKEGARHVYSRRTMYSDEDSWRLTWVDLYDTRGELWRLQESMITNWYDIPFCYNASEFYYDVQSGRYIAVSLRNEEKSIDWTAADIQPERYTPDSIRRLGVR